MAIERVFKQARLIYYDKMADIFKDDFDDPEIYQYLKEAIETAIDEIRVQVRNEEIYEPLPGKLVHNVVKQFCKVMVVDMYSSTAEITDFIINKLLTVDAYRYLYNLYPDYQYMITNLNEEYVDIFKLRFKENKNAKFYTTKEKWALFFAFITPFFPFAIWHLVKKYRNEKEIKEMFSDKNMRLLLCLYKYSEIVSSSTYNDEYYEYDVIFKNENDLEDNDFQEIDIVK